MNLIPTTLNRRLSDAVLFRISSEKTLIAGRSAFWRLIGVGVFGLGLGTALGVGFYGYSYIQRSSENLVNLSAAFSKALADANLHATATGTVSVNPNEISLAKGQTISLDSDSRVRLDPTAKVLADGELRIQAPSISPQPSKLPSSASTPSTITNFTIFKRLPFEKGAVMTGWKFLTSAQKFPTSQYCYYTENSESPGLDVVVYIAEDMKLAPPKTIPKNFDLTAAFDKCFWFASNTQ